MQPGRVDMEVGQIWVAEADDEEGGCGSGGIAFVYFQHLSGAHGGRAPGSHIDQVGVASWSNRTLT